MQAPSHVESAFDRIQLKLKKKSNNIVKVRAFILRGRGGNENNKSKQSCTLYKWRKKIPSYLIASKSEVSGNMI